MIGLERVYTDELKACGDEPLKNTLSLNRKNSK
jgi:hypothetical protein